MIRFRVQLEGKFTEFADELNETMSRHASKMFVLSYWARSAVLCTGRQPFGGRAGLAKTLRVLFWICDTWDAYCPSHCLSRGQLNTEGPSKGERQGWRQQFCTHQCISVHKATGLNDYLKTGNNREEVLRSLFRIGRKEGEIVSLDFCGVLVFWGNKLSSIWLVWRIM